ncbi:GTP binding protein Sey1 [Schizosaccharomyces cryophilus OY26]|uniref:GTP binding protein Sey1 n=1 Tax=Schizosaccharomyces cryophilus (strain OY26 / ATCC MYA-4695 / CBS 11777 / NBRC 106824 / NRRL Y48691) TaxID=653667 RepID=S9VXP6_SCHCR|nr:GTP binding protein Sey1 [Schizosaccharomyces cryophilus OY26]EPY50765.1 GTP binding protein Sey1 [Schizosaccharomyces cryophilus OY26]
MVPQRICTQIVDENKSFNKDIPQFMRQVNLADAGFNYHVVAVLGSQSTGKSTLLNQLFGTTFDVMDAGKRQQTTKGIWLSKAQESPILVMDVEGTDGRERGDDQDFERKSALFSIATSEVIIVNMWEHQVGLYQGSNMVLLKTVLEVHLQLFHAKKERSLLQFVIRDYIGTTSMENLSETIKTDLMNVWSSLAKPPGLESSKITDFFDLGFTGLPHKILCSEAFDTAVDSLRTRFANNDAPDYVFDPSYHKRIPADGFSLYTREIWETIENNKDLDLPTQQQLLAQYRCDEIIAEAMEPFTKACNILQSEFLPGNICENLPIRMQEMFDQVMKDYDRQAKRYNNAIYEKKKQELLRSVDTSLYVFFQAQLNALQKELVSSFMKTAENFPCNRPFKELAAKEIEKSKTRMQEEAQSLMIANIDWDSKQFLLKLSEELESSCNSVCKQKLSSKITEMRTTLETRVAESLEIALQKPNLKVWDGLLDELLTNQKQATDEITRLFPLFMDSTEPELNQSYIHDFKKDSWIAFRKKVALEMSDVLLQQRLRMFFEETFRYDSDGMPKLFKKSGTLDRDYRDSVTKTLELIQVLSCIKYSDGRIPELGIDVKEIDSSFSTPTEFLTILNRKRVSSTSVNLKRTADLIYLDCKRSLVSTQTRIPPYFWALLLVLGWNELMAVLRNPFFFMLLVLGGSLLYILYATGMIGPARVIANRAAAGVVDYVTDKVTDSYEDRTNMQRESSFSRENSSEKTSIDGELEKAALS